MAYGWFSPVKGTYPGLAQEDKTAKIDPSVLNDATTKLIVRGTILTYTSEGYFKIAAKDDADVFFSLQTFDDTQAEMAGATWYDNGAALEAQAEAAAYAGNAKEAKALGLGIKAGPALTGLSLHQSGEYQTSEFEGDDLEIGDPLVINNGKLAKAGNGDAPVALVTKAPFERWCNDAPQTQVEGRRQGAMVRVIQVRTAMSI